MKCRLTEKCLQAGCEQAQTTLDQPTLVLGIHPCAQTHGASHYAQVPLLQVGKIAFPWLTIVGEEYVKSAGWRKQAGVVDAKPAKLVERRKCRFKVPHLDLKILNKGLLLSSPQLLGSERLCE